MTEKYLTYLHVFFFYFLLTNIGNTDSVNGDSVADDEQIYWLRPKLRPSPTRSPNENGAPATEKGWLNKKLKPKVTFNDLPSTSGSR